MLFAVGVALRLHFRNRLALLYSYLFPTLFLLAFWVLYRYDQVPLVRHMGALLTVTILGGACFGLPTTIVSERERGVWRRYRLAPVSAGALLASTLAARYLLLVVAGLLQLGLALGLGMPAPRHPGALLLAFTLVAAALLALGLLLATLAPTVPAVQALGQCLFLPMLIVGGIAVPLASLPDWAQRVSGYFPGRYAVETLQAAIAGPGLGAVGFSLVALLAIGAAALIAALARFRWDPQHRAAGPRGPAWVAVGVAAHVRDTRPRPEIAAAPAPAAPPVATPVPAAPIEATPQPSPLPARPLEEKIPASNPERRAAPAPAAEPPASPPARATAEPPTAATTDPSRPASWREVTMAHIERDLRFDRLPPDNGVVTPIAPDNEEPDTDLANHLDFMASTLIQWAPAQVPDPVQRVRNVLFLAAVPDVFQMEPLERFVPWVVFEHLRGNIPPDDLPRILYWIAMHPSEGDDSAVDELRAFKLGNGPSDIEQARERAALYAVKLLGRITGQGRR